MKLLVFLHGTVLMHKSAGGKNREEAVSQVKQRDKSVLDYFSYIPIGNAVKKLISWKNEGATVTYLSSHKNPEDVLKDKSVLEKYGFPGGEILFRKEGESYAEIVERYLPEILIEDDCESIGGKSEMVITGINPEVRKSVKSFVVREFEGIDELPDSLGDLLRANK